jgi:hypothetical protein
VKNAFIGIGHALLIGQLLAGKRGWVAAANAFAVLVIVRKIIDATTDFAFIVATVRYAPPFVPRLTLASPLAAIKAVSETLIGRRFN